MPKGIALQSRAVFTPYEYNEHIDLKSAFEYHTYGGAYQNFLEDVFSKRDKSPKDTEVVMTLFDGRVIYSR